MKKIVCLLLVICVLTCSFSIVIADEKILPAKAELKSIEKLKAFGVLEWQDSFKTTDVISRAEFVHMLIYALGINIGLSEDESLFSDVDVKSEYAKSINQASALGYIQGFAGSSFMPNENILSEQAIKILVTALGYEVEAESKGGYPTGYFMVASSLKLFSNVNISSKEALTRGSVVCLINNALETEILIKESFGQNKSYSTRNNYTLMNDKLNIYKGKGIVEANQFTELYGEGNAGSGNVIIEWDKYFVGNSNADLLLGHNIEFYYKKTENEEIGTILYSEAAENKNMIYQVRADEISVNETTLKKLVYQKEGDTKKATLDLSPKLSLIYNGKCETMPQKADLTPASGSVTLIDNNNDDVIDVVLAYHNITKVVNTVNIENETIYPQYGQSPVKLGDDVKYSMKEDGILLTLADLKQWDVLSIAESKDGTVIEIIVTDNPASGTITETIMKDDKVTELVIDGVLLKVEPNYPALAPELKMGSSGVLFLNSEGKISGADFTSSQTANYAYLINAKVSENIRETASFQIFTKTQEVEVIEGADKIKFNDQMLTAKDVVNKIKINQLITYDADKTGKICEINTAYDYSQTDNYKGYDLGRFSKDAEMSSARFYRRWGAGIRVGANTVLFYIPTDKSDLETYKLEGYDKFPTVDITLKNVSIYDLDVFNVPSAIVIDSFDSEGGGGHVSMQGNNSWFVVSKVVEALDYSGEAKLKLCGYLNNSYTELFSKDKDVKNVSEFIKPDASRISDTPPNNKTKWGFTKSKITDIKAGDVIQVSLNGRNEIIDYRQLFSASLKVEGVPGYLLGAEIPGYVNAGEYYEIGEVIPLKRDPGFMSMLYTAYGEIVEVLDGYIRYKTILHFEDETKNVSVERVTQLLESVYLYNESKKEVSKITANDIKVGDRVFLKINSTECRHALIIK